MQIVSLLQNQNTWILPLNRESALDTFLDAVEENLLKITPQTLRDNFTERKRQALKTPTLANDQHQMLMFVISKS